MIGHLPFSSFVRPVSISLSYRLNKRVFDRVVYYQIQFYLDQKQSLYKFQSSLRSRYSIDTRLIHLTYYIKFQTDQGRFVGMISLDLQKAFDTVDYAILLMKLEAHGLSLNVIGCFRSYVSDRQQLFYLSGT